MLKWHNLEPLRLAAKKPEMLIHAAEVEVQVQNEIYLIGESLAYHSRYCSVFLSSDLNSWCFHCWSARDLLRKSCSTIRVYSALKVELQVVEVVDEVLTHLSVVLRP